MHCPTSLDPCDVFVSNSFLYPTYPMKIVKIVKLFYDWNSELELNNWLPLKINIFFGYLDTLITCAVWAKAQHNLFLFFKHAAHRRRQQDRGINFRIDSFIQRPLLSAMMQAEFSSKSMESWRRGKKHCVLYNGLKWFIKRVALFLKLICSEKASDFGRNLCLSFDGPK